MDDDVGLRTAVLATSKNPGSLIVSNKKLPVESWEEHKGASAVPKTSLQKALAQLGKGVGIKQKT